MIGCKTLRKYKIVFMKKIFTENDTFNRILYSESYIVNFTLKNNENIWTRYAIRYFTSSKNAFKYIESFWKHRFPSARLISIKYE